MMIVSIPNGMEFYFIASKPRYFLSSFNSQRDGILPGWSGLTEGGKECFNSQRDGILPISNLRFGILKGVSIPNGMEFYSRL